MRKGGGTGRGEMGKKTGSKKGGKGEERRVEGYDIYIYMYIHMYIVYICELHTHTPSAESFHLCR